MSDKHFMKDVVSSWSIFSNGKCQHTSGWSKIQKWQKHRNEKRKLKFRNYSAVQSCGKTKTKTKSLNFIFQFYRKMEKENRLLNSIFRWHGLTKYETGNLNSIFPWHVVGNWLALRYMHCFFVCEILCKVWSCTSEKISVDVIANHSKLGFSTVNWVADSEEIHLVYSTEILSNIATIREVNSTEIVSVAFVMCHNSAKLQRTKQTLTALKNLLILVIEFTYGDYPCHLKVNRGKRALINLQWKSKKAETDDDH